MVLTGTVQEYFVHDHTLLQDKQHYTFERFNFTNP